ncbi:MAG TPA: carboxypeptidase regulatory-like domain-containing protein [Candidatus Angelobacter sp.]
MALILCVAAVGQVLKGSISGTATDPQGAVIKDAKVKATNTATLNERTETTDSNGSFRFNLIPAGDYKIEISAPGFKTLQQTHITVVAGSDTGLGSFKLEVGDTSTTVEVTAAAPLIESTQAQVTNTFSGQTLSAQPGVQANEGLDNIALFAPGVSPSRDNNFSNLNGGLGFSVNGIRGRNNDQQIDGQNNNDNSVAGPSLFVTDPEWVSQYVLITNNFGPEYGRNAGSVVNVLTKQGGNQWHGSIYGYENNSVLNAMTNFQKNFDVDVNGNPLTKPPRLNDEFTGVTLGGPWVKNKFFLSGAFNQEFTSTNTPFASSGITPTPAGLVALASCFPTGAGAQAVAAVSSFGPFAVKGGSPVAQNVTTGVVTACPQAEFGTVVRNLSTPFRAYDFYTRADVQLSHDTFVARYIYNRSNFSNLDDGAQGASVGYPFNEPALSQATLASWTHNIGARMVNELRLAYGRLNVEFGGNTIGNTVPQVGQLTNALTNVTFQNPAANVGFGPANTFPQGRFVNTWQAQDNFNYVRGRHTFKLGANWTYQQSPNTFLPNVNGQFLFPDWNGFFANTPSIVSIANGVTELGFKEYDTFAYVGDDWKATRNLTLNLGLTWTYYGKPADLLNTITVNQQLNPATRLWNPALPLSVTTNPGIPGVYNSFGPSAGFAWAPQRGGMLTGRGKTVIRGGYRLSYDPPFYNIYLNVATSAPQVFSQTFTGTSAAGLPLQATPTGPNVRAQLAPFIQKGVFDPQIFNQTTIVPNFKPDQVSSWTFGVQREVSKNSVVEVRYVGNHALHLFQSVDGNPFITDLQSSFPQFVPPGLTPCPATAQVGPFLPSPVTGIPTPTDLGRVNCGPGVLRQRTNSGYSHYNAVQAEVRANGLYQQLTMRAGYTYSKTSDNVSEIFSTFVAGNTLAFPQNPTQPVHGEYSFSGLDYPNTFYALVSEQLPFFRNQHGWAGHILGGWGISANYLFQTGQRYTPAQVSGLANATAAGNFYDSAFIAAFNSGIDTARPFVGNLNAPETAVGIFAGDACLLFGAGCALSPTQLISVNAINTQHGAAIPVTSNQVRFIMNGGTAQTIFGTPFGNMPRNIVQDARTNIGNLSVSKNFNIRERASFEFRASCVNVLNHPNFSSVDPFVEDAGNFTPFNGFGNPQVSNNVPGTINFPNSASRRLIFGGVFRF